MSLRETLRKPNWLNEFRGLVSAGIVLTAAFQLYTGYSVLFGGGSAAVTLYTDPTGPQEFELGGQAARHVQTELELLEPTAAQAGWYLATTLPASLVLLAVLIMLLRLLSRARQANPFTRATVRDLRWIGWTLIVGGTVASLISGFATVALSEGLRTGAVSGVWEVPIPWLFAGFGVLAVSEIVARGCALREELDGVV